MPTLEEAKELLNKAEQDVKTLRYDGERAALFRQAGEIFGLLGDIKKEQEMKWEFLLFWLRYIQTLDERKKLGTRFAPVAKYTNGSVFPDIKSFNNDQIEYTKREPMKQRIPF